MGVKKYQISTKAVCFVSIGVGATATDPGLNDLSFISRVSEHSEQNSKAFVTNNAEPNAFVNA